MNERLTIGIVGAGSFALFAAKAFLKVKGIRIKAVTDIDATSGVQFAIDTNAVFYPDEEQLFADSEVDLIYIGTPPYLHYRQSLLALKAGKHVICEKPAALKTIEAEELAEYARKKKLLYTVNLMQHYNPLYAIVKTFIDEKWLGDFVHGFFENYASDEKLVPEHWFWDKEKSGGIFIEHGVHFFDMFHGWLGKGKLSHAVEISRDDIVDRVQAIVMYENNPVNFYHGFNQPKLLDRQELRLQFDRGDITLYEWIPVKIRLHGLFTNDQVRKIMQIFPGALIENHSTSGYAPKVRGKFKDINYDSLITITFGDIADKMFRYEQLIISMITDQWQWIKDDTHVRIIDETNAVESLRMAEEATIHSVKY